MNGRLWHFSDWARLSADVRFFKGKADLAAGHGILNNSENNPERKSFARKVKLV